jgi:hypothetical protein
LAIKSKRILNAWINNELRECTLTFFDNNAYSAVFDAHEEIAIWLEDDHWNIEYFFESVAAYSAKIIAYARELKTEHILALIQMTYEMANYGEVKFEYD